MTTKRIKSKHKLICKKIKSNLWITLSKLHLKGEKLITCYLQVNWEIIQRNNQQEQKVNKEIIFLEKIWNKTLP